MTMELEMRNLQLTMMAAGVVCMACGSDIEDGALDSRAQTLRRDPADAEYRDCDELAGLGLVPLSRVEQLVPSSYTIIQPIPGFALLLVQGESCAEMRVEQRFARPGALAQLGVGVASPLGAAEGDFYQVLFSSTHPELVHRLRRAGANAYLSRHLQFAFVGSQQLDFRLPRPRAFAWVASGPITPPDPLGPVTREKTFNLWCQSATFGNVLQQNTIYGIRENGVGEVTLTAVGEELQQIVGDEPFHFSIFSDPETFERAEVKVLPGAF
jgi:hypothetical protein